MNSSNPPSHEELVTGVLSGDTESKEILFKQHNDLLLKTAHKYLGLYGCQVAAQHHPGVAQDAWIKIFKSIHQLEVPDCFPAWAYIITKHKASEHCDQCRKRQTTEIPIDSLKKKVPDESQAREINYEPASIEDAEAVRNAALLVGQIVDLTKSRSDFSPKLHFILLLRLSEDLEFYEIAPLVGESPANTRNIYYRGTEKIKRILRENETKCAQRAAKKNDRQSSH